MLIKGVNLAQLTVTTVAISAALRFFLLDDRFWRTLSLAKTYDAVSKR